MIHGLCQDPQREFFIQHISSGSVTTTDTSKSSQEANGELGIMGVTGRQMQAQRSASAPDLDGPHDSNVFVIQADLLPSYIPIRVANKILFVGESVQMFEINQQKDKQHSGQFMKERETEFTRDFQRLSQQPTFSCSAFEALVDKIRSHVAEHLWVMVVQEADLTGHLRVMKDFFLLGRGELFLAFIDQAQHLLKGPPAASTEHGRYNRVFRFLLAVRRTQQDLQSTWQLQMLSKAKVKDTGQSAGTAAVWQLRHHMSFLVDNLQYYLQVDVIESQYGLLLDQINSTRDFEAVKLAHEQFLAALLAQSFVHMKSNFQRQSSILFRILSSVSSHNASPHLTQLLLRLDFNKYYTTAGGQLGRS
nr:hypothetical protein BaRGS_013471 [Batillaria attramentaria]